MNIGQFTPGLPYISHTKKPSTVESQPQRNQSEHNVHAFHKGHHINGPDDIRQHNRSSRSIVHNILAHVRDALQSAPDTDSRTRLLDQAREGITQGVAEAREQLEQAGLLDERAIRQLDAIEQRLGKGLDRLAQHYLTDSEDSEDGEAVSATTKTSSLSMARLEQRSVSVRIETLEGDVVTLNFNKTRASGLSVQSTGAGEAANVSGVAVRYVDTNLSYQVEGDLNDAEQAAIDNLIQSANRVANRFFGGQLESAFKQAARLGLDTETLSSFSLSLERSSIYQATASYQSVASLSESNSSTSDSEATPVDAAAAVGDLKQLTDSTQQQPLLANPLQSLPELLEGIASAKGFDLTALTDVAERLRNLIADLLPPPVEATGDSISES